MSHFDFLASARRTIESERDSVNDLLKRIDPRFAETCELLMKCSGRLVLMGVGKSGHIATKLASTFASTGTPAFFVHPGEASHGDLGMVTEKDTVVAISYSGNTAEIAALLPTLKRIGCKIICMTGNPESQLAKAADRVLDISVDKEACPLGLAPTSSTTVSLVLGDALAIALLEARGFTAEDFAYSHPGGILGRKLLLKVEDVMHIGDSIPVTRIDDTLMTALQEMTSKGFGMTTIINASGKLVGVFTDGDLRRCIDKRIDLNAAKVAEVMSHSPQTIKQNVLAAEALNLMQNKKITALVVANSKASPVGVLHMHDLLRAGLV